MMISWRVPQDTASTVNALKDGHATSQARVLHAGLTCHSGRNQRGRETHADPSLTIHAGLEEGVQDREELERQRPSPFPHPRGLGWHPIRNLTPCTRPSSLNAC